MVINFFDITTAATIQTALISACFLKKLHVIAVLDLCHVGTGTVQHNQTKAGKKNDHCQKAVIIIIHSFPSYGSFPAVA